MSFNQSHQQLLQTQGAGLSAAWARAAAQEARETCHLPFATDRRRQGGALALMGCLLPLLLATGLVLPLD